MLHARSGTDANSVVFGHETCLESFAVTPTPKVHAPRILQIAVLMTL